ncbi:MAG: hypothetical protein UR69_C0003G0088 [Candidatus Moranbacteria bacterium GW2011_GWE2_35_2-]|nr:MAG: hypothetical protein UR69_C0003G0088 [Candidatus Moranbacteria bacterium GW2011_GWE2_35_2-]KKQ06909.1 MAG: hypothetical protein US15_C0001G0016 [Candidatus Moranbacteria bacterium GW2011_GWF1_36_4]KKQ22107.1 MAG: hypothetical protein US37_C0004G0066 [Candidatus Moranbacteria bacterium GW2011_GWF2_37_11]KKQ29141.1 MAG: hypothetical protein US44_C0003G0053 [Candidatus Moranbacteria bacterium GW2011_GWD1_37_17]KKQ31126.1 MAG: hypothetical protein US47_C0001G0359 [Candidatus Moranbacteria b
MSKSKKQVEAIVSAMGVFTAIISTLVELVKKFGGTMENIYRLAIPEGLVTLEEVARVIVGAVKVKNEFLCLIFGGENLIIDECNGREILADASDVFDWIDSDFRSWGADEQGPATKKTPVQVYELEKDGKFPQIYGAHSSDLDKLCLTQHQIKKFVQKCRDWLRTDGYGTFFLFKSKGHYFVAGVGFDSGGRLWVSVHRLENVYVWDAENRYRFVFPQLDI